MAKPFDISKFRKSITKSIEGLGIGFNDPTDWISTGNYTLNYLLSGNFEIINENYLSKSSVSQIFKNYWSFYWKTYTKL